MSLPRLILLPGMGTDQRLIEPQRQLEATLEVPPWLPPKRGESLAHYGRRMAEAVRPEPPYFLGGISLGGMVALEMARHLEPRAVFLIGSCRCGKVIPRPLRLLEKLNGLVPVKAFAWFRPFSSRLVSGLPPQQQRLFVEMFRDTPPEFLKWACTAAVRWEGVPSLPMPVYQIHGRHDRLLPPRTMSPDLILPDAGHLINLTHPQQVNAFLRERMVR